MYTIYKHTSIDTGKHYIGQTKYTMEHRWNQHCVTARHKVKVSKAYAFASAIIKYGVNNWTHDVLEYGLTKEDAIIAEQKWINHFDSYNNGYNSTLGGDYFDGCVRSKGEQSKCSDNTIFKFTNIDGRVFFGTTFSFAEEFGLNRLSVYSMAKKRQKFLFGWTVDEKNIIEKEVRRKSKFAKANRDKKINPKNINSSFFVKRIVSCKIQYPNRSVFNTPVDNLLLRARRSERFKGAYNPTAGNKRPAYIGEIVSKRRYEDSDKTLYKWLHTNGTIEILSPIDLRNKYPEQKLLISHLGKMSKGKSNYHKGWKIEK